MYITNIRIKNLGPIADLNIKPRFSDAGSPVPIAIVGQNGSGKSLTLGVLLDALIETRRIVYTNLPEVDTGRYLRLSNKSYIKYGSEYTIAEISLESGDVKADFREVVTTLSFDAFTSAEPALAQVLANDEKFTAAGFYKDVITSGQAKQKIESANFLYFPYFRYEKSFWMSESAKIDFVRDIFHYGESKLNPVRTSILDETRRWILNILLDRELYERKMTSVVVTDEKGTESVRQLFDKYEGQSTTCHNLINQVLTNMLQAKDAKIETVRIGIGPRISRTIPVIVKKDGSETTVANDLGMLSSGELMVLAIATEIIRAHELVSQTVSESLSEVTGVVLIDEADLHLHISFQKAVLPSVMRQFPNVQFIITTHSPLMVLGLDETGELDVYDLPIGNKIEPSEFSEFLTTYEIFIQQNEQFRSRYYNLQNTIETSSAPLIVTEGKTDWQILKDTINRFKARELFTNLNVQFFEFDDSVDMGDTRLKQMCEAMSKLSNGRKIIFAFDRDNPKIVKDMSGQTDSFRSLGNNVYSFCLPVPKHRNDYENLTIELMYTDDDLRTRDPKTNKRLWFSNEINIISEPGHDDKTFVAQNVPNPITELRKKVFDQPADKIVDSNGLPVGLSKAAFTSVIVLDHSVSAGFNIDHFASVFTIIEQIIAI